MKENFTPDIPPETNYFEEMGLKYPEPLPIDRRNDLSLARAYQESLDVVAHPDRYSEQYVAGHMHFLEVYNKIHGKRRLKRVLRRSRRT